jgi:branched-chain amino acid aminotransferase
VNVGSLAMRYGMSVFEGIRGYRRADGEVRVFMLDEHILRLHWSLRIMGLPDPGIAALPEIIAELLRRNEMSEDVYIRPSVHGVNNGDLNDLPESGLTVNIGRMGRKPWLAGGVGMRATVSSIRKLPHDAFPSSAKCIAAYANTFIANTQAKAGGFDVPLLLNHSGFLTESPTAALFLVKRGALLHAPETDGVLPSITAHVLKEIARRDNIPLRQQHIRVEDLITSEEAFLCGTGLEIAGINSLDGQHIGDFAERPVTQHLVQAYFALVRGEVKSLGTSYGV